IAIAAGITAARAPSWGLDLASNKHKQQFVRLARRFGVQVDTRDRIDVIAELHEQGVDAVPAIMIAALWAPDGQLRSQRPRSNDELLAFGGISNSYTILCNESGQY